MAVFGSLPFVFSASATTVAGWISYRAILAGASPTAVRKTCTSAGLGLAAIIIVIVPLLHSSAAAMVCLMIASFTYGVYTTSHWAITQTIAGPLAAGRWTGMQNCLGNLAGVVAPAVTGLVVQSTGHFSGPSPSPARSR